MLIWFCLFGAVAFGVVALTSPRLVEPAAASAIIAALLICWGAGLAGLILLAIVVPRYPDYLVQAGMAAMIVRLGLTVVVGAIYLRIFEPAETAFMYAMVVCYLVLLAVETGITVRLVKRYWRPPVTR